MVSTQAQETTPPLTTDSRIAALEDELSKVCKVDGLEAMTETEMSFLLRIGVDTRMGARLANCIFRSVFGCPEDYKVQTTIDLEE